MSWNLQKSVERIQKYVADLGEIQVEKLVKDADLSALLTPTNCRQVYGAHVYVDVPNFSELASHAEGEDFRRVIQAIHLYHREVARIVENPEMFDGVRIHFQGPKLHALFFRPIDSSEDLAGKAVLLQIILRRFVDRVFNPAFPLLPGLTISGGADLGNAIGTKNGLAGDRELLFLGAPANYAAKIIGAPGQMRVTAAIFSALPLRLRKLCSSVADGVYQIGTTTSTELAEICDEMGVGWNSDDSSERLEEDKRLFPLKSVEYSEADSAIDLDSLGVTNNKRVCAASLFADVSGFTKYVDAAQAEEDRKRALKVFHAIRKEMAHVVKHDFSGLRIQYQGDRIQALFHLPKNEDAAILKKAVETAAGLQSSMEYALKQCLPEAGPLGLAIGIDLDVTLVSKIGTRGQRDRICIGYGVENAARAQEKSAGGEVSLTQRAFQLLDEHFQPQFNLDEKRNLYVASNFYSDRFERAAKAAAYGAGAAVTVRTASKTATVVRGGEASGRQVVPSKNWSR
jgi:class 3 adenylate cyclase